MGAMWSDYARVMHGADARGQLVFVVPGQASQWPGMARELMESSEVFALDGLCKPFSDGADGGRTSGNGFCALVELL